MPFQHLKEATVRPLIIRSLTAVHGAALKPRAKNHGWITEEVGGRWLEVEQNLLGDMISALHTLNSAVCISSPVAV